jgi:hypothetical protein
MVASIHMWLHWNGESDVNIKYTLSFEDLVWKSIKKLINIFIRIAFWSDNIWGSDPKYITNINLTSSYIFAVATKKFKIINVDYICGPCHISIVYRHYL